MNFAFATVTSRGGKYELCFYDCKYIYNKLRASDYVYQLLAHGRWFSPGTPASSTTKTSRHDIAEILLKVAFNTKNKNK
jgi:hypothetical protein